MKELSYLAHEVYAHDRDLFLRSMFVPPSARESLLAVYALVVELDKIPSIVSEEMIGHIRYAWWQEALEGLYAGQGKPGHPVLEALAPLVSSGQLPQDLLMPLIENYRAHFPAPPPDKHALLKTLSLALIPADTGWEKADHLIISHRKRYGRHLRPWLLIKLLLA